jgi:hypothetical protein
MAVNALRKLTLLATLASMAWASAALTVSVAPAEGKEYASPPEGPGSPIGYLVSGCLGVLFDAGFVVTDDSPFHGTRSAWAGSDFASAGAKESLVDFIVALYVDWKASSYRRDVLLPNLIAYKLVRVSDGKTIIEGDMAGNPDSEEASAHFAQTASQAGAKTALPCVESLRTLAMGGE